MPTVDDYISTLDPSDAEVFARMSATVKETVPDVVQGVSYSMPAFLYRGKAVLSIMVCKKHYGLYPFSGKVINRLQIELSGFEKTMGSVHFSKEKPIGESLLKRILETRMDEIDSKTMAAKS